MNDPISDMIIRIKNADNTGKDHVVIGFSKLKMAIAEVLLREGYIKSSVKKGKKVTKQIEIGLVGNGGPRISGVKRISTLSRRTYAGARDIEGFRRGHGLVVLSTPKGILTHTEARKDNVGGEILFKVW